MGTFLERTCSLASGERRNTFTVIWRVHIPPESYSLNSVESPAFNLDFVPSTFWKLGLYRGDEYLSLYLYRDVEGPKIVEIDFELSLLILGDLPQRVKICRNYKFLQKDQNVYGDFLRTGDVVKNSHVYLQNGCLTVRCRMWHPYEAVNPVHFYISTIFTKERVSFNWPIEDYFTLPRSLQHTVRLNRPIRKDALLTLRARFEPNTKTIFQINIFIRPLDMRKLGRLVCTVSLVDLKGNLQHNSTEDCPRKLWYDVPFSWNFPFHVDEKEETYILETFLRNDFLTLRFEFEFWWSREGECDLRFYEPLKIPMGPNESTDDSDFSCPPTPSSPSFSFPELQKEFENCAQKDPTQKRKISSPDEDSSTQ